MPRIVLAVSLMLAALLAGGSTALAAGGAPLLEPRTVFDGALAAPAGTYETACHRAYRPGRAGVATESVDVVGARRRHGQAHR